LPRLELGIGTLVEAADSAVEDDAVHFRLFRV